MCGKTEIAKELSKRMHIPTFKASTEHDSFLNIQGEFLKQLQYCDTRVLDLLRQTGHSVIFDRGFPCEWVYSNYFKRQTDIDVIRRLDREYSKLGAKLIVCNRTSYKGIIDDLDPSIDAKELEKLDNLYLKFVEDSHLDTLFLNVDDENLDREVNEIMTFIMNCDMDWSS
jgi:hypothetical protein